MSKLLICDSCDKKSTYGYKGNKEIKCEIHKIEGMVKKSTRYCEHLKMKKQCRDCGGSSFCEHSRQKHYCIICKGIEHCNKHGKTRCKECNFKTINIKCEHGKRKRDCVDCKGVNICKHGRIKYTCKECKGKGICIHNRARSGCKECKGGNICKHNKAKAYCIDCGGSKLCKSEFCSIRKNKKYDDYCTHCFSHLFPSDPRTLKIHKNYKEIKVVSFISNKIEGFIHDKPLYVDLKGGCCDSKRRIDLRKIINGTMLCIEIDEDQHKHIHYKNDNNRYDNLFMDFSGKYVFIRYNPDKYKINGKVQNPTFKTRMKCLLNEILKQTKRIENSYNYNNKLVEINYMYYDVSC